MKKSWSILSLMFVSLLATGCGTMKNSPNAGGNGDNGGNGGNGGSGVQTSRSDLFVSQEVINHATRAGYNPETNKNVNLGSVDSYYEPVRGLKGKALKDKLKEVCRVKHQGTWDSLKYSFDYTEADPDDPDYLILMYTSERLHKDEFNNTFADNVSRVNREHVWPDSKGVGSSGKGADKHMQRICEKHINSERGNLDFGYVTGGKEFTGINAGNKKNSNYFEPKDEWKGDAARIVFYMATIYGGSLEVARPSDTGRFNSWRGGNTLGKFDDLYKWAMDPTIDPVSKFEMNRNNVVDFMYQNNRNPFVDHPEFVEMIYDKNYSGPGALN